MCAASERIAMMMKIIIIIALTLGVSVSNSIPDFFILFNLTFFLGMFLRPLQ